MTNRGSSVRLQRSLRMRVSAACAMSFLGVVAVVCLAMPRAYEEQARAAFDQQALTVARTLSFLREHPGATEGHDVIEEWLRSEPLFLSAAITSADGTPVERWPVNAAAPAVPAGGPSVTRLTDSHVAFHPMVSADGRPLVVSVRLSSDTLTKDLENVRWLFASLFLFTSVVFYLLSLYLTRTILNPIEEIGRAAMDLADGEPNVHVPTTGDREIDDLGA
ncbi:MAG: HAMP domain-containing protein, partial [Gemmatimonadetes bacterium]|nr:HAMP domain-containing protein [Gemmatimonadota bacterium]